MPVPDLRTTLALLAFGALCGGPCSAQGLPGTASARFQALDVNQDGVLSKYEYDSDAAFDAMDDDQNNQLSAPELQAVLGPVEEGAPSAVERIRRADLDGDGELSDAELRRGLEFRFQWLDGDKDGNVDLAELKSGMGIPMVR